MIAVTGWKATDTPCGDKPLKVEVDQIPCFVIFLQPGPLPDLSELPDSICTDSTQPTAFYL